MKSKMIAAIAAIALTALAFSPLQAQAQESAQERVSVWTVPSPQTVEVKIAVEVDGVKTSERTVSVDAPPGAKVTVTKTATPTIRFVSTAEPDPFAISESAEKQYRMLCDGKSCQRVPVSQTEASESAVSLSTPQRQGIFRRLIQRLRARRGCSSCGG